MTLWLIASAALAIVGGLAWFGYRLKRAGRIEAEHDALAKAVEIQHAQLQAGADAPRTREELVDRLRSSGL